MDVPTPPARTSERSSTEAASSANTVRGADISNILIINSEPAYPNQIAISRYFRDAQNAAAVRRLVWAMVGLKTDGLLHFGEQGTFILLQEMAQARLWGGARCDTAQLTSMVQPMNVWMQDRAELVKGKRGVAKRITKSDEALDEFGYPDLRRTLLSIAGRKSKNLQILDTTGNGGILQIPPRGHLVPVSKKGEPPQEGGAVEVLGKKGITQMLDLSGTLAETLTARVSGDVVEGGHAFLRHPHRTSIRSQRVQRMDVVQDH